MKRTISLILVLVMCLSLCACGGEGATKSNEIDLTLDNYTNYMKIRGSVGSADFIEIDSIWFGRYSQSYKLCHTYFATSLSSWISTDDIASNYNYNNVKITIKFTGTVPIVDKNTDRDTKATIIYFPFEFVETFDLMLNGTPKDSNNVYKPQFDDNMVIIHPAFYDALPLNFEGIASDYEIVGISGTVSPA